KRSNDELRIWQRRVSRELEMAGGIQRRILNTTPWLGDAVEVWMLHQPSQHVGGDVFDTIPLPDGRLCVYMGDVAGHGVGPAMVSSLVKALLSELVREFGAQGPGVVVGALRERFEQYVHDPEIYLTLFIAILDPAIGAWRTLNCGHPGPILLVGGEDRSAQLADRGELPVGINVGQAEDRDTETLVPAVPDSLLVLYTDGLTEARLAGSREECGVARLAAQILTGTANNPLGDPVRGLIEGLAAEGYVTGGDDCSVLMVRQPATPPLLARDIEPSLQAVDKFGQDVAHAIRLAGWCGDAAASIRLLVAEHAVNVLRHSQSGTGAQLHGQLHVAADTARLVFHDTGREWQFEEALERVAQRAHLDDEGGRGLKIIRALASGVYQYRRDECNVLVYMIEKGRVSAPPAEEAP
ncbi:MAG: ATP-binding SpoIIE family protein phosphatase, partial [bacterium]